MSQIRRSRQFDGRPLTPKAQIDRQAWAAVAFVAVGLALVFAAFVLMRSQRIRSALQVSRRERTQFSRLNVALNREIEERRAVEAVRPKAGE